MISRQLEDRLGAHFQEDRALLPPDALVSRVLEIPATRPHTSPSASRRRLMLLLAAALLTAAAVASAIAIGQSWPITVEELPPPNPRGEFQPTGTLPRDVRPQALVAHPDGSALLIGDRHILRFDPRTAQFAEVGRLQISRTLPATVLLNDGRLLIIGGGHDLSSPATGDFNAEIYDPATGTTHLTGPTVHPRGWGTATLLDDGRVLVTGGEVPFAVATAEIFDPATETFVETGAMSRPRSYHAAVRLDDGRVLVIGGAGSEAPPDAELFDPATGRFTPAGAMPLPPRGTFGGGQNALLLSDGRVLILEAVGESAGQNPTMELTTTIQFYDPTTDTFTLGPSVPSPRQAHRIALLDDSRVLILGGWERDAPGQADDAYIYDPNANAIVAADPLNYPRLAPFVATLADGRVLVVGSQCWNHGCYGLGDDQPGAATAEVFD